MSDYTQAREHFVDMGEQMHRWVYEMNVAWGKFLDFYSDLNNARKEDDESFVDKNNIGEEVQEDDDPVEFNSSDLIDEYNMGANDDHLFNQ